MDCVSIAVYVCIGVAVSVDVHHAITIRLDAVFGMTTGRDAGVYDAVDVGVDIRWFPFMLVLLVVF